DLSQPACNIFVGNAMEPVPAYPLLEEWLGNGEPCRHGGQGLVKGGVEASNLGNAAASPVRGRNGRQIVRLMEGRQRCQSGERFHHMFRYKDRSSKLLAAMNDAVTDADQLSARGPLIYPAQQVGEKCALVQRRIFPTSLLQNMA